METTQEPEAFIAHPCELIPKQQRLTGTVPEPGLSSHKTPSLHFHCLSTAQHCLCLQRLPANLQIIYAFLSSSVCFVVLFSFLFFCFVFLELNVKISSCWEGNSLRSICRLWVFFSFPSLGCTEYSHHSWQDDYIVCKSYCLILTISQLLLWIYLTSNKEKKITRKN